MFPFIFLDCKLFIDVDKLFTKGNINEQIFNKSYKQFCPKGVCNNNYDRIGALCEYLLAELPKNDDKLKGGNNNGNRDYEYIYMWLADKFLKVNDDYSFSLNDYYEELIVKHGGNFGWWEKLDDKMFWKDSNIILMARFYYLLMDICNALLENEKSELDLKNIEENDKKCYLNYYFLNQRISRCSPYAQLLVDLKKTYDEYKILVNKKIQQGKHDKIKFSELPPLSNNKNNQPELTFDNIGCKLVHLFLQKHGTKYKPKKILKVPKSSSNGENKHKESKKETHKPTNNDMKPSAKNNTQQSTKEETKQSIKKENQPSEPKEPDLKEPDPKEPEPKEPEPKPPEPKTSDISQKSDSQVQILPKISQEIQEVPQNNNHASVDAKDTSKDVESISENHANKPEIVKNRSKRDLSLSETPQIREYNAPLSPPPESTNEKIPVKYENIAVESTNKTIEPTNITADLSDNLPDTESGSAKRTKRSASQDNSENQKETTKTENTDSSSTQSKDTQESSDSNKELNIKKVIDYSVDFFRTYSSLFNDVVNKIEDHIQEIVVSKINDIIEKIHKYQQIIQKVGSTIGQIQILNDHQNGSEKSPDTQNEVGSAQGNANHGINNLKNSTNETNSQQKNLETKQGSQNSVSENQGIGSNISEGGINTDNQSQKVSPATKSTTTPVNISVTAPSSTQKAPLKIVLQPQPSITLPSSAPGTIPIAPITTNGSAGEKVETTMSSIESTLYEQNGGSNKKSRRKRSADSGSSINILPIGSESKQETLSSTTVADVKMDEKPSIWCIGSNKKCDIIGIGIIGISIFVFLAFMFKYLSFGSRKKSKKKKITKKVINLVDGRKMEKTFINSIDREKKSKIIINSGDNKKIAKIIMNSDDTNKPIKKAIDPWDEKRKTHITINSDDNIKPIKKAIDPWDEKQMTHITINSEHTKKYTKSVINSSDRKKTKIIANSVNEKISLLNIYKFMKADPIPFINLFFLLIFFVYKRKYNFL
ncbi:CIR protein [Plasmodium chabaudi chabaudi]|uniref:CIR protein n=1 Tax=Plasmodium chabaudi chabaudi TaxID=31271 RepID=A0A4V0K4J8_PLACU|nr:CIR protein [Plasmodium chabaudi chabaudi]VTZ67859.1 CIR protein [Plasmodium chabaudi chabaudi]|eukprot:XP_016654392.1 CIR protein [Plasmodium chabaudi chabaudi]